MREVKFRVWDKINKSMHPKYGVLAEIKWDQQSEPCFIGVYEYVQIDEEGNGDWDGFSRDKKENFELMQFTGLKDINGKEIYEGDIVGEGGLILKIVWDKEHARFQGEDKTKQVGFYLQRFRIIGNIYENPELLESET